MDLADGQWHMLAITTIPGGGKGFRVYVDGLRTGELGPGSHSLAPVHASAGGPAHFKGPASLCGRRDGHPARHFPGRLAGIGFWNTVRLSPIDEYHGCL